MGEAFGRGPKLRNPTTDKAAEADFKVQTIGSIINQIMIERIEPLRAGEAGRRLAAVAFVDIVGYTILMASDETRTHQRWMMILNEVISPQAEKCRGTLVKSTGDGVLVEFPSAHDAVEWAREVQRQVI